MATMLVGCIQDEVIAEFGTETATKSSSAVSVNLHLSIPDPIKVTSRAGEYDAIESMTLFCFNEAGKLISTSTPLFTAVDATSGTLAANITHTTRVVHLVANQDFSESTFTLGTTTEDVFQNLVGTSGKMIYWARVEIPTNVLVKDWNPGTIQLLRNQAKVTVTSDNNDKEIPFFQVTGFTVVNTSASGTVVPYHAEKGYPTNASATFGLGQWAAEDYIHVLGTAMAPAKTEVETENQLYVYETLNTEATPASIIVKGYNISDDTKTEKYWRVSFTNDEGRLMIRRNHHYQVVVVGNMSGGSATFAEALTAPTANEAFLNIADEITAVTDGKHSLTLEQTSYVLVNGTESLSFNLTVEKLDAEAASIDKSALKVEWIGEQNVSSTTMLVPTYSVDTESKLIVGLSVSLLTLDDKTKLEGTILIKYSNKLQRKVKITVIPKQEMTVTHTDEEPGADITAPIATLTFTIPDTYPGSYPFNVLISTNDFNVRKSSDDQKDISLVFPGDGGYGDDNEVGYKYVYQVTQSGAHTVNLINSGIVQDIGKLTLEAELFESVDYEISLKRS